MNDFLVGRADRRQHSAELCAGGVTFAADKVVGTKAHAARQGNQLTGGKVIIAALDDLGLMIPLQDAGRTLEAVESSIHRRAPIDVRKIAAQVNAARAPGILGETG